MRVLHGVSEDRQLRFTSTPSEPLLALGAAMALHGLSLNVSSSNEDDALSSHKDNVLSPDGRLLLSLGTIRTNVLKYIDKGRLGEMLMRLVLILARDFAQTNKSISNRLHEPITLTSFLESLLGANFGAPEQSTEVESFKAAFRDTYINFTHWAPTRAWMPGGRNYNEGDASG